MQNELLQHDVIWALFSVGLSLLAIGVGYTIGAMREPLVVDPHEADTLDGPDADELVSKLRSESGPWK